MDGGDGGPPPSHPTTTSPEKPDQVMSEVHLGCPPNFSGPFISNFTVSIPPEVEVVGSRYDRVFGGEFGSVHRGVTVDDDGDLLLTRRGEHSEDSIVMTIQHNITSSIPSVGLQVWRAELVLADFVLHKMLTSSEFDGIIALELGADYGTEVLENCAKNVHLNSGKLLHKASIYVRQLNWKASWPPELVGISSQYRYGWSVSEVEELQSASFIVAADVIYSDDLTDALFSTLEKLMSQGTDKVLYMALEKRYNFSLDDLDIVANGYSRFRHYVRDEEGLGDCNAIQNGSCRGFAGKRIDLTEIPQYVMDYDRGQDVEIWQIRFDPMKS